MGTEGKGQGMDLRTLEKPVPLSKVRGYPWYMPQVFCFIQIRSNVLSILLKWLILLRNSRWALICSCLVCHHVVGVAVGTKPIATRKHQTTSTWSASTTIWVAQQQQQQQQQQWQQGLETHHVSSPWYVFIYLFLTGLTTILIYLQILMPISSVWNRNHHITRDDKWREPLWPSPPQAPSYHSTTQQWQMPATTTSPLNRGISFVYYFLTTALAPHNSNNSHDSGQPTRKGIFIQALWCTKLTMTVARGIVTSQASSKSFLFINLTNYY